MVIIIESKKYGSKDVIVDDSDFQFLKSYKWHLLKSKHTFYAYRCGQVKLNERRGSSIYMHRVIMNVTDSNILIDHRNENGIDNRKSNLRKSTKSQNAHNSSILRVGKSSKYKRVYFCNTYKKWVAESFYEGKRKYFGRHDSEHDARVAVDSGMKKIVGEFFKPNKR